MAKKAATKTPAAPKPRANATVGDWDFSVTAEDLIDEVPVIARVSSAARLPFDWDGYAAQKKAVNKLIPLKFWTEGRGLEGDAVSASAIKERVRRAFYGWQEQSKKAHYAERSQFQISFSDQYEGKEYTGTMMYFFRKAPAKAA